MTARSCEPGFPPLQTFLTESRFLLVYRQGMESPISAARLMTPTVEDRGGSFMRTHREVGFLLRMTPNERGSVGRRRTARPICRLVASEVKKAATRSKHRRAELPAAVSIRLADTGLRQCVSILSGHRRRSKLMCDYSLHSIASRRAKVGDQLVTTEFANTATRGFASIDDPLTAVCLFPGTELVFDRAPEYRCPFILGLLGGRTTKVPSRAARFRQTNLEQPNMHHDALEFADGTTVLLTRLCPGQRATVLQLPADAQKTTPPNKHIHPLRRVGLLLAN
jgi:hypothetical protein